MFGLVGIAEASVLGWTQAITNIANEIRNVGLVILGLGIILLGIRVIFRRHLEDLGDGLAALGVGGALIGTGVTVPALLLGFAASQPVAGTDTALWSAFLGFYLGDWVYLGWLMSSALLLWRGIRHA